MTNRRQVNFHPKIWTWASKFDHSKNLKIKTSILHQFRGLAPDLQISLKITIRSIQSNCTGKICHFHPKNLKKWVQKWLFSSKNFFPKTMTQQRRTLLLQNKWLSNFSESKRDRRTRWRNYQCKFLQLFFHIFGCKKSMQHFCDCKISMQHFMQHFLAIAAKKNRHRTSITKWLCFICKFCSFVWVI